VVDLTRLNIRLRPRTPWEGIDLGFALARRWFLPLWLLWLVGALPVFLVCNLLLPIPLWAAGLLSWWCKPFYEPPLLFWLGRTVFGERLGARAMRRRWFSIVWPQLFANLSWRRLTPARSFVMPVVVLEGLEGRARASRIRVLSHRQHAASWLTLMGVHFEIILELGLLLLFVVMLPQQLRMFDVQGLLFAPQGWQQWLQQFTGLLAMSVIAPFYVAGGFGLYLTRRGQLEAWDVELGLRHLAHRLQVRRLVAGLAMGLLVATLTLLPRAEPLQAAELTAAEARELVQSVMQSEDFGERKTRTWWEYVGNSKSQEEDLPWLLRWLAEFFKGFARGLAAVGEILMWLAAGGLLAYLIYWVLQHRGLLEGLGRAQDPPQSQAPPARLVGLDIRPQSLPRDLVGEAGRLLEQGELRAALGLLYRGALSALIHRYRLQVPDSATEDQCLELARQVLSAKAFAYQQRLTRSWQRLAYAHRLPGDDEAMRLWREWAAVYAAGADE